MITPYNNLISTDTTSNSIPDTFNLTINSITTPFKVLSRDNNIINIIEEYSSNDNYTAMFGLFRINEDTKYNAYISSTNVSYDMTLYDNNNNLLFDSVKSVLLNVSGDDTKFLGYMKTLYTFQLPDNTSATVFKTIGVEVLFSFTPADI